MSNTNNTVFQQEASSDVKSRNDAQRTAMDPLSSFVSQEGPSILRLPKTEPQQVALDVYRVCENLIEIQRNGLGPPKSDRCFEGDIFQKATRPSIHVKSLGCRLLETYSKYTLRISESPQMAEILHQLIW